MKTLHIFTDQVMQKDPNGDYFSNNSMGIPFWSRYLSVFDRITIVCRIQHVNHIKYDSPPLSHPCIDFVDLPFYKGPVQFLRNREKVIKAIDYHLTSCNAALLRMAGTVPGIAAKQLLRQGKPYSVEVIGDPAETFVKGAVGGPAAWLWRQMFVRSLRKSCAKAASVAYVNCTVLPRRYPAAPGRFWTHYSNVDLPSSVFIPAPRAGSLVGKRFRIFSAGSMQQRLKGFDTLIETLKLLTDKGYDLELAIAGDGIYRGELEHLAEVRSMTSRVTFLGKIGRDQVLSQMDRSDLFVLASRGEGKPRAMIEAMARGLPCVGSTDGGIPELLEPDDIVPPGNPVALTKVIEPYIRDIERRQQRSSLLLERAHDYADDVLSEKRRSFYASIPSIKGRSRIRRAGTPA